MDSRLWQEFHEKTSKYREIRGTILALAFEIEYSLDSLLTVILAPQEIETNPKTKSVSGLSSEEKRSAFNHLFLKSGPIRFARKVKVLRRLTSEYPSIGKLVPEALLGRLREVIDARNRFAHYPITFVPKGSPPKQTLEPVLVCKDKEIDVDEEYLNNLSSLLSITSAELRVSLENLSDQKSNARSQP